MRLFAVFLTTKDTEILKFCYSHARFLLCNQKRRVQAVYLMFSHSTKRNLHRRVSGWNNQQTSAVVMLGNLNLQQSTAKGSLKQCSILSCTLADRVSSPWLWAGQKHVFSPAFSSSFCNMDFNIRKWKIFSCCTYCKEFMVFHLTVCLLRMNGKGLLSAGVTSLQNRTSLYFATANTFLCDLQSFTMLCGDKRFLTGPSSLSHLHKAFISMLW